MSKTDWHFLCQTMCTGTFLICTNGLVKLTFADNQLQLLTSQSLTNLRATSNIVLPRVANHLTEG